MLQLIGIIAIIWFIIVVFYNIFIYVYFKHNLNSEYTCITRDTYFYKNECDEFIIIPTINIKFIFKNKELFNLGFGWLYWYISFEYIIKDDTDEQIEFQLRSKNKEK